MAEILNDVYNQILRVTNEFKNYATGQFSLSVTPGPPVVNKHDPLTENITIFVVLSVTFMVIFLIHNYYSAYTVSQNCKVVFTWTDEPTQVGETAGFAIMFYQLDGTPQDESTLIELIEKVSISIKLKSGNVVPHRLRPVVKNGSYVTLAEFEVHTAGIYQISLTYEGFSISGSPFFKVFLPGVMDPSKSYVDKPPKNLVVCTEWVNTSLEIVVLDKNGNKCNVEDVEFEKFKFVVSINEVKSSRRDEEILNDFIYSFDIENVNGNFKALLNFKIKKAGVYNSRIVYDNCLLKNGFFTIISVSPEDEQLINQVLQCGNGDCPCYPNVKAKLIAVGTDKHEIPLDIYVEVTPRNLTIKQVYWNVLTSNLSTFSIASRTKLCIVSCCPKGLSYVFSVADEVQKTVILEMDAKEARIVLILFAHFMCVKTGKMIYFEDKEKFFYSTLLKSLPDSRFCYHVVSVSRKKIIQSSYLETKYFSPTDWRKSFVVSFVGEKVNEGDGLKDWLFTLCDAFFDDDRTNAMFVSQGGSRFVHPNCSLFRSKTYTMEYYYLAGKIIAKCLIEASANETFKGMVLARFTRSFLAQLIGLPISYKHFEQDNPELYNGTISSLLKSDLTLSNLTFTEPVYDHNGIFLKNVDIIPNGSLRYVNNDTKEEYLNALANHQLKNKVREEVAAFRDGLQSLIPEDLLAIFDENELELLMCGNSKFDINDLKKNHVTGGSLTLIRHQCRVLNWLWKVLAKMSPEEKGKFLQFTTGTCLLPRGGFKELRPKFKILVSESMNQMPSANKQLNQLAVSDHYSFEEFEETLLKAIRYDVV